MTNKSMHMTEIKNQHDLDRVVEGLERRDMETKTTHTPGPWPLTMLKGNKYQLMVITARGNHYVTAVDPSAARLIVAAPELLDHAVRSEAGAVAALEELDSIIGPGPVGDYEEIRAFLVSCRDEARAAIAIAKGRVQR